MRAKKNMISKIEKWVKEILGALMLLLEQIEREI
jgi:hypothetical protein